MMFLRVLGAALLLSVIPLCSALGAVTLPYTFSSGNIKASEVNANFSRLRDGINNHEALSNAHNTDLFDVLSVDNSVGSGSINFNLSQGYSFRVENLSSDPTCNAGSRGRLIFNSTDSLFKICTGSSFVSIAGSGVNTLESVLNAGNSAGSLNINLNGNQLLNARIDNRISDPGAPGVGQMVYRTDTNELKVCDGATCTALGGAQGLASVLGVSNATGGTDIDFDDTELVDAVAHHRASDPSGVEGKFYYNTGSKKLRFHNGSGWLEVGNTNTLAQTLLLGNSAGSSDINLNGNELVNARVENLAAPPGTGQVGRFWYDTITDRVQYGTPGPNKEVCSLDDVQVLTNKTISGASNTFTNIPDSALSANVVTLTGSQTVSGTKTFSGAPVMSRIKTPAGTVSGHLITDGLSDDTFVLANAVQTLSGKTLNAPTLSGNLDFNLFQGVDMRLENVIGALPATSLAERGRMVWSVGANQPAISDGVVWKSIQLDVTQTWAQVLLEGNSAGGTNPDFNFNQALNVRLENLGVDPAPASVGRVWFNTTDGLPKIDDGTTVDEIVTALGSQTLENKTIDAGNNTISGITDTEIDANADIARSKLADGTADHVLINDAGGAMSSEAQLALSRGGTNKNMTASAGSVAYSDADSLELTAVGSAGQLLQSAGAGAPAWTTATYPSSTTANQILYSSANNVVSEITTAPGGVLITNGSGVPAFQGSITDGQVLMNNSSLLSFQTIQAGHIQSGSANQFIRANGAGNLNESISLNGTTNQVTVTHNISNTTLSLPQNIDTGASVSFADLSLSGTLSLQRRDESSAATVDDLDSSTSYVKLTATVTTINGIEAGVSGQIIKIFNATGSPISIVHESGSAAAADQIRLSGGIDLQLLDDSSVEFIYDSADSKWVSSGGSGGGGGALLGNGSSGTPVSISATGVAFSGFSARQVWYIEGSGGPVDITANPQIAVGNVANQELILIGTSDTDTVLFEDGNGLSLNGDWYAENKSVLGLIWDDDASLWVEMFRR